MKKSLKIAGGLFLTAGIVGLIYRYYKREYGKLRAQESSARKEVEEAGISFDKLQDEVTTKDDLEGNTFIKSIATAMFFNNTVPLDYLDLDAAFTGDDGPGGLIHIMESSFNQRRCLDFLFELPNYVKGYFSGINRPRINEYIKTIKSLSEMVNDEIVKGPRPLCKPELYVGVRYILDDNQSLDKDNDCESSYFLIPQPVYADYADETHDGLNSFYTDMITNDQIGTEEFKKLLVDNDVVNIAPEHFKVTDLRVMVKVSYRIASTGGGAGITFLQAPQVANRFAEELEVTSSRSKRGNNGVRFEHILIHPRVEDQEETGELPCTVYENINSTLQKSEYLI